LFLLPSALYIDIKTYFIAFIKQRSKMEQSCIILIDVNAQCYDLNWIVCLLRRQTLVFITEVVYLTKG